MKVLLVRADNGASAHYRLKEPARVLSDQYPDLEIKIQPYVDVTAWQDQTDKMVNIVDEVKEDVDLIVFQRPLNNAFTPIIKQAKKQGIATIVELDDDFETVHRQNLAYWEVQPSKNPHSNYEWVYAACAEADMVVVSTPALAKYSNDADKVRVIPNFVPESLTKISKSPQGFTKPWVGWTGTVQTHPTDLPVVGDGVARALDRYGTGFFVVGDGADVDEGLGLRKQAYASGWVSFEKYHQTIKDTIAIGIVPLETSEFNDAKTSLKGLEYASLGIPFVASPTPDYLRLEAAGVGKVAHSPDEWYAHLSKWLKNPKSAYLDGQRYRKIVAKNFTYEDNAHLWYRAWTDAVEARRGDH